jgi:hypothetical protein
VLVLLFLLLSLWLLSLLSSLLLHLATCRMHGTCILRILLRFREESAIGGLPGADPFSTTKHVPRGVYRAGGKLDRRATHALATRHGKVRAG